MTEPRGKPRQLGWPQREPERPRTEGSCTLTLALSGLARSEWRAFSPREPDTALTHGRSAMGGWIAVGQNDGKLPRSRPRRVSVARNPTASGVFSASLAHSGG
jgi:hypothetical protein